MAEKVDSFEFLNRGERGKYPWNEWLDGSIWKLKAGDDFKTNEKTFQGVARVAAYKRGLSLKTNIHEGHLFLQASCNGVSDEPD